MTLRTLKSATLLALAVYSTLALADDPPARVGRVALTQGQVSISSAGETANAALVNWPVTSNQTISTAPGARTELRIGSTAIRLDGDSALEVMQLDDDRLSLRLHYGSASIRVVSDEVAGGFELTTPQARVLLQQPGRLRVDAERERDTSSIRVFDGVAVVEGGGERLTVRSGRSAEVLGQGCAHDASGDATASTNGPRCATAYRGGARHPLRAGRDDRLRRPRPLRQLARRQRIRRPVAADGRLELGALPRRPLDLYRPLGLDLGRQRALGLCALPLRALGASQQPLGLGPGPPRAASGVGAGAGRLGRRRRLEPGRE